MNSSASEDRVGGAVTASLPPSAAALAVSLLAGGAGGGALGWYLGPGNGVPSLPVLAGAGALLALGAAFVLTAGRSVGSEARFYRDRLEYDPGGVLGRLSEQAVVEYEDIDLVFRRDRTGDERADSATYELVRSGKPTITISHLDDPETVERHLRQRVPSPRARVDETDEAAVRTALQHERVVWRRWPDGDPVPESAVVTDAALAERFDTDQSVAAPNVSRTGDETPTSVTAADFENGNFPGGGGSADADFTGGSGQHSPGHASNEGGTPTDVGGDDTITDSHT